MVNYLAPNQFEIYLETYGCTANQNSSEIMKGLVKQAGLNITENPDFADIVVINSCIVKQATQEKIRKRIRDFLDKDKKVILAGCMPRFKQKSLEDNNLFLLETSHAKDLISLIKDIKENNYDEEKYLNHQTEFKINLPKVSQNKFIGITQISEGCQGNCSYCLTRLAKGNLVSYPLEKIIDSIKNDIASGCKEVWITSQDNASYGNDSEKFLLPELLKKIISLPGKFKIRLGMMNPNNVLQILDELIEIYKDKKMFKFLHIPIQSGNDNILKLMNRKYTQKDFLKIINKFQKEIPEITISTDVIVGFPEETEKEFQETVNIIKKIKPEILNRSNFSAHKETPASKMKQVPSDEINKRAKELMKIHLEICKEIQKENLGKEFNVLIDQKGFSGTFLGRTDNYKLVAVNSQENILGKNIKVKIKKTSPHYLIGEELRG